MKHLKLYEEFELPLGRTNNAKQMVEETFEDLQETYPGVRVSFSTYVKEYNEIDIVIPEVLRKDEIKGFYDEVLAKKIEYLESSGIKFIKPGFFPEFYIIGERSYKKISYRVRSRTTDIKMKVKKY